MNRRSFLTGTMATTIALAHTSSSALDVTAIESPLIRLLRDIPDRSAGNTLEFPPTLTVNHTIRKDAPGEVPDMYWDPYGEDLSTLFDFHTVAIMHSATQMIPDRMELWKLDTEWMVADDVTTSLQAHGWQLISDELRLLRYEGSDDERAELVDAMNLVGHTISEGGWDMIALPDDNTMVLGADEDFVLAIADRVRNHTALTAIDQQFHGLGSILPVPTYESLLLPPEKLPTVELDSMFVSKSWDGGGSIVHSVGVRTANREQANALVHEVPQQMATATSTTRALPYGDFLNLENVYAKDSSVRFDFVVTSGEWDVIDAAESDDLLMLPTST